jgi:hypothetical protein
MFFGELFNCMQTFFPNINYLICLIKFTSNSNNELIQVVRVLVPLIMWSETRFLAYAYGENSLGRRKPTLCAPQIPRRRLVIVNDGENFISIS